MMVSVATFARTWVSLGLPKVWRPWLRRPWLLGRGRDHQLHLQGGKQILHGVIDGEDPKADPDRADVPRNAVRHVGVMLMFGLWGMGIRSGRRHRRAFLSL